MGGRGSSSSSSRRSVQSLEMQERTLQKQLDTLGQQMAEQARYALPSYTGSDKQRRTREYYRTQRQYNETRQKLNKTQDRLNQARQRNNNSAASSERPFVNSFGEATTRNITSATYERSQRSQERRIRSLLGGNRR